MQQKQQINDEPALDSNLLKILVCPVTRGKLDYDKQKNELVSVSAGLAYPIKHGIPIMLPSQARKIKPKKSAPS